MKSWLLLLLPVVVVAAADAAWPSSFDSVSLQPFVVVASVAVEQSSHPSWMVPVAS